MNNQKFSTARHWLALFSTVVLAGCGAQALHNDGLQMVQSGQVAAGLQNLRKAAEADPSNARYRIDYLTQRSLATQAVLFKADDARNAGRLDESAQRYREALKLDEASERAQRGLQLVGEQRRADAAIQLAEKSAKAGQTESALDVLRRAVKDVPGNASLLAQLRTVEERIESERAARDRAQSAQSALRRPVTLQFRDANLRMVFEALSRASGINIILDRDVKADLKTTIYVKDASVEDTIELILLQNQLDKRVLNQNTLFVYPAVAGKQKEYGELKVRSFQLSNIDAAYAANMVKTLLKTKDIVTDARTNTMVMRDTQDAIAVAEKLIAANDVPDPEVMLEVEVLEVSADRLTNLGVQWPESFSLGTPRTSTTLGALRALTRNELIASPLGIALNLQLQDTDTNILASPRIRTRNKEKARILVGDKVPVITNLLTPQQAGQTSVITGSIQYVDVGIKLEVEPQVYADGDVGIKINLEVSNIAKTITTESGIAYQIGTRSAQTSLRLKDGETQVLAGLINDQDRSTSTKIPGLGQVPIAGRLFSSTNGAGTKSEIVLSITPHIIRPQTLPDARVGDVWSGTEAIVRERQLRLDPIGAARTGVAELPGLPLSQAAAATAPGTAASAPAPAPTTGPKAGGAGGSSILGGRAVDSPAATAATAAADGASGAGTGPSPGAAPAAPIASNSSVVPSGGGTAPVSPRVRRAPPANVQPGRAMAPSMPSAPAGSAPPAPAPAPALPDEG